MTKAQDEEAKETSQLPLDFLKETLAEEFDGVNPTSLQNEPPMIQNRTATDINSPL